jgi:hypothetical protein
MGDFVQYEIACPKCSEQQQARISQSIDAELQPELREALLANRLNICECVHCGYKFRIDAPIFYRDPELGYAILCIPGRPGADNFEIDDEMESQVRALQTQMPPEREHEPIQLVKSYAALIEQIFIQEAHMDPRIVEYIKYLMHTRNSEKLDPNHKRLLFNAQDSSPEKLLFIVQDLESHALEGVLEYDREAYLAFSELFDHDELTPDLLELFPGPCIDARICLLAENIDDLQS